MTENLSFRSYLHPFHVKVLLFAEFKEAYRKLKSRMLFYSLPYTSIGFMCRYRNRKSFEEKFIQVRKWYTDNDGLNFLHFLTKNSLYFKTFNVECTFKVQRNMQLCCYSSIWRFWNMNANSLCFAHIFSPERVQHYLSWMTRYFSLNLTRPYNRRSNSFFCRMRNQTHPNSGNSSRVDSSPSSLKNAMLVSDLFAFRI